MAIPPAAKKTRGKRSMLNLMHCSYILLLQFVAFVIAVGNWMFVGGSMGSKMCPLLIRDNYRITQYGIVEHSLGQQDYTSPWSLVIDIMVQQCGSVHY